MENLHQTRERPCGLDVISLIIPTHHQNGEIDNNSIRSCRFHCTDKCAVTHYGVHPKPAQVLSWRSLTDKCAVTHYGVHPKPAQMHTRMMAVPKSIKSEFHFLVFALPYLVNLVSGSSCSCLRLELTFALYFSFVDFSLDKLILCVTLTLTLTQTFEKPAWINSIHCIQFKGVFTHSFNSVVKREL